MDNVNQSRQNVNSHRRLSTGDAEAGDRRADDWEELRNAAMERAGGGSRLVILPPKDPAKSSEPRVAVVDSLTRTQRKMLVSRTMDTEDQDAFNFLTKVKDRFERVGVKTPSVEIRWENLTVEASVSVGKRGLPSLIGSYRNFVENALVSLHLMKSDRRKFTILNNLNGILPPGRLCLLLGPPGSGKSSLLQALAGKLQKDSSLNISGNVTYNGHDLSEFYPARTSAYVNQFDEHMAELTVRETLDFSRRVQGAGNRLAELEELKEKERAAGISPDPEIDAFMKANALQGKRESIETDYVLHVLGLNVCADTMVGSQVIRGISGGQKKRVTTGEMIAGPKRTLLMDEISTGLDSSTTYQIVRCLRDFVQLSSATAMIALLQPAPEVFDIFDDVLLLSEGHTLYHGPKDEIMDFFRSLGFDKPERKGIPDFLQEVSGKRDQKAYWVSSEKYRHIPVLEIAEKFQEWKVGREMAAKLATPFPREESHPAALVKTKYALQPYAEFKALMRREETLIRRTLFIYLMKTFQVGFMGLVSATLFLRTQLHPYTINDGQKYASFLFFSLIIMLFNGIAEMSIAVERFPVYFKQRDNMFYTALSYCSPATVMRIPYSLVEALVWSVLTYFEVGLSANPGRFFMFFLLLFWVHQWSVALFRMMGSLCRNIVLANAVGLMSMLLIFLMGGFVIPKQVVHPWVVWLYWLSPMQYAQRALIINEFTDGRWQKTLVPASPFYPQQTMGNRIMSSLGFPDHYWWCWIGVGVLIVSIVLFNYILIIAHQYFGDINTSSPVMSEEQLLARDEAIYGDKAGHRQKQAENGDIVIDADEIQEDSGKGLALPFNPMTMTFLDLHYFVDLPPQQINSPNAVKGEGGKMELELLRGISGAFRPKRLTALMGVTGAGKTTLMDVLAGRKTGGRITGDIRLNGFVKEQDSFARVSAYVEQFDIHQPFTTVVEALNFSCTLRTNCDAETVRKNVDEVMKLVELENLSNSIVGRPGISGLSVEQRKRLTIAVELVANPSVVFMDEPTSGLDARAAAIVMRTVRNIVDTGRTIVCTIHQPSIDIFEAFDELVLLKRGGETIFCGSLGLHSCDLIKYFSSIHGIPPIQDGLNPASWMLEVSTPGAESRLGIDFADIYRNSDLALEYQDVIAKNSEPAPGEQKLHFESKYARSQWEQYITNVKRYNITYWRTTEYNAVRFLLTVVIAFAFGFIFWKLGGRVTTQIGIQSVLGALFASTTFLAIINSIILQPVAAENRSVMYRERAAGMFDILPWVGGMVTVEIMYCTVQAVLYTSIVYFACGFARDAAKFFWFLLYLWQLLLFFTLFGLTVVALTPNIKVSAVISSNFYSVFNLFAGFIVTRPQIPGWWVWMAYLNPCYWTIYGLVASQIGDYQDQVTVLNDGRVTNPVEYMRSEYGYHHDYLGKIVAILFGWLIFLFFVSYICFKYVNHLKR